MKRRVHHRALAGAVIAGAALVIACGGTPTGFCEENSDDLACDETVVSETEVWALELEQLDGGSESPYRRRGTITMRLELNRTTQFDPACEGHESGEEVTTFLADVEAFASRLQSPASGTADGSWNCHGFAAAVRLSDDTEYELISDHSGSPPEWSWGGSYSARWTAGGRRGEFHLRRAEPHTFDHIRESHVDVLVQNQTGGQAWVQLYHPDTIHDPLTIDYVIPFPAEIPEAGTLNISWPAHSARRERRALGVPPSAGLEGRGTFVWGPGGDDDWRTTCFLAPDHGNQVQLIVHGDGPECGDGWFESGLFVAPARSPLFVQAGTEAVRDTVTLVITTVNDAPDVEIELLVENTDPGVTGQLSGELLTVTVAPEVPLGEHGVWVTGRLLQNGNLIFEDVVFIPLYVYDLEVTTAADTLSIVAGGSDTTSVLIDGGGYFSQVRFHATDLPPGVLDGSPSFSPSQTNVFLGVASLLRLTVREDAAPGVYDLTLCTTIVLDSLARCHPTPLALVVLENEPPAVTITSPADGAEFEPGASIDFIGSATDAEDGALSGTALAWTSSLDGLIGTGGSFTRSGLSVGTHTITLTATDSHGGTGSASVGITVSEPGASACGENFDLRLDFNPIPVAAGGSDVVAVFVDRAVDFTGQVSLQVDSVPGGPFWAEVMEVWAFDPNPVASDATVTALFFMMLDDLSVGASYDFEIVGASPDFDSAPPDDWCRIPITFEVIQ